MRNPRLARAALWALAVPGAVTGVWAAFAPRSFYDDFPGGAQTWVAGDGPFNEHLVRDVGELYLGMTVMTLLAALWLGRTLVRTAAGAWLVSGVPHLVYHLRHLDPLTTGEKVNSVVVLLLGVALPLAALWATGPRRRCGSPPNYSSEISVGTDAHGDTPA